jgi:hypothetical protein
MDSMRHTPGPWRNNGGQIEGPGGYPNIVARVGTVNEQAFQDTANARLIEAAPDLLWACECILGDLSVIMSPDWSKALRGESHTVTLTPLTRRKGRRPND